MTNIPLWFVLLWDKKYSALQGSLPSDHEFDNEARRDDCRKYNRTIREELMRRGYVRPAGGPITARWKSGISGGDALAEIGFYYALAIAATLQENMEHEMP